MSNQRDQVGEALLNDVGTPNVDSIYQKKQAKERKYISFLPKMYWFLYRKPIYFLLFIPTFLSGWMMTISNLTMAKIIDSINEPNAAPSAITSVSPDSTHFTHLIRFPFPFELET